ncbi:MAG TPA: SpoIID/LytB domain-containing protein [Gaiellaceae bacterium]|nr:SpoIID/LytB domain-containing protein [Gaiellaceae bacterium]
MRVWIAAAAVALAIPTVASGGTVFLLDGRGWGHGVGMSQWGAEGYARHGYDYKRILAHYYPGTHVGIAEPREVRVLLVQAQPSVRIGSTAPFMVVDARGRKLHLPPRAVVVDKRFMLKHIRLARPLRFVAGAQPLQVDLAAYRGDVVVTAKPGGLMAVNVLPLDRYLRGVVPWEAPKGWHVQTYEAQAVAARSYTLATLKPGEDFDLYPDQRSQMYGGVAAERLETNLAIGATAGQVLVWRDRIVPGYYFSTSGGRTSSVHDAWPRAHQVPYLVSVSDPYDYLSPHHVWPTEVLSAGKVASVLGLTGVRDIQVLHNSSGRARAVRVLTARGWRVFPGAVIRTKFHLGSTDFDLHAMELDDPGRALYGQTVHVTGFVRGLGKARLQQHTEAGWVTLRHVHVSAAGRFSVALRAVQTTEFRLAYNGLAGEPVGLEVAPRVVVSATGSRLQARVRPALPLKVERLTNKQWRAVASARGAFDRSLRPGSYRVTVRGSSRYAGEVSVPVAVHPA